MRITRTRKTDGRYKNYWRMYNDKFHIEIGLFKDAGFTMLEYIQDHNADEPRQIHIGIKRLFSIWFNWTGAKYDYKKYGIEGMRRVIGFRIHSGALWCNFWGDDTGYGVRRDWSFHPIRLFADTFFGKVQREELYQEPQTRYIYLPEGYIPVTIKRHQVIWKRPRWFSKKRWFVDILPEVPIPIPGKGESSWDLDDDAIYESTIGAYNISYAIDEFRESIIKRRLRYGGYNWEPQYKDFEPLSEIPD